MSINDMKGQIPERKVFMLQCFFNNLGLLLGRYLVPSLIPAFGFLSQAVIPALKIPPVPILEGAFVYPKFF
jgi:hypothetical protein